MGKHYKPLSFTDMERINKQKNIGLHLLFDEKEKLVGMTVTSIVETLTRKVLLIDEFIIDKKNRSKGYGTELMKRIMDFANKSKVSCMEVFTKDSNKIAQKLYKKFGFEDRKNIALRLWLNKKR